MGAIQLVTPGKSISRALSLEMPQCDEPAGSTPVFPRPSYPQHLLLSSYHQARLQLPRLASRRTPNVSCSFRQNPFHCFMFLQARDSPLHLPPHCLSNTSSWLHCYPAGALQLPSLYFMRCATAPAARRPRLTPCQVALLRRTGENCHNLQAARRSAAGHRLGIHCHCDCHARRESDNAGGGAGWRAVRGAHA
jgi:hypothetical protein